MAKSFDKIAKKMKNDSSKNNNGEEKEATVTVEEVETVQDDEQQKEIEDLKQQVEEIDGKYKRALADYQNLQKRVIDERVELIKSANKELLLRLLPVLDT